MLETFDDCAMETEKFEILKQKAKELKGRYSIKDLVAEVYNIFQDYRISETQEMELYKIVDPDDEENCPAELWFSSEYGCVELWECSN